MMLTPKPKTTAAIEKAFAGLSPEERDSIMARVRNQDDPAQILASMNVEMREVEAAAHEVIAGKREHVTALESLSAWGAREDYKLEKNDCSRLHKLAEALHTGKILNEDGKLIERDAQISLAVWMNAQSFVVQHDWAAAFKGATDYIDGDFRLPYTHCAFEFRISGRTVIVIAFQIDPDVATADIPGPHLGMPYVECANGYWYFGGKKARDEPIMQYAWAQIRAISVALDAEVAERDVIRAPTALNERRKKEGKVLLRDFHVVKLRGRQVRQQLPGAHGTHRSPRLHFRRGHWRHFETHKTWIKWMLVGDPELGFIDKAYRL